MDGFTQEGRRVCFGGFDGREDRGGARCARPFRNGVKRRRQIVMAAALAFGQYGYHGASLRQIADEVGTTNATLIAYFGSKEGLLVAVLEHWREETAPETDIFRRAGLLSFIRVLDAVPRQAAWPDRAFPHHVD